VSRTKQNQVKLNVFVLRHGEAGVPLDDPKLDDERSLTKEGRREVEDVAESLVGLGVRIDAIASSPLPRALQTAEIVARKFKKLNILEEWDELKHTSETTDLYRRLARSRRGANVMLVGHEPHLSGVIAEIISGKTSANILLKKAGLAKIRINEFKPRITGELRWLLPPKLLGKMAA
jgi:phosphohistidine phosphatase